MIALFKSIRHIFNVLLVLSIIYLIFAIIAVNLFEGRLFSWTVRPYEIINEKVWRLENGKWKPYDANYDSVPDAMLSLFIISTLEGWPDMMHHIVDSQGENIGPKINSSPYYAYFFVIFIFVTTFFFLNFLVGVIFMNFQEAQRAELESLCMEKKEVDWVDILKTHCRSQAKFRNYKCS